jgi:hypothetical protein
VIFGVLAVRVLSTRTAEVSPGLETVTVIVAVVAIGA